MIKKVQLALSKYPSTPISLREDPLVDQPKSSLDVDPARLFHHFYLDTRGCAPPDPNPANFEHLTHFRPEPELRVVGEGFGTHTAYRRATSNQLGQAFCRWFLHDHLDIIYFAHMEHVLECPAHSDFGGHKLRRIEQGDAPDYLCAENPFAVFLAEAKGRVSSISFSNQEFKRWRQQFDRVVVDDSAGTTLSVKGHIVATRFATDADSARIRSKLFAEDPASPGNQPLREAPAIATRVIALHYAGIATKLRQPVLAAALASSISIPPEISYRAAVWEFVFPELAGKRFVGGFFGGPESAQLFRMTSSGRLEQEFTLPFRLDVGPATFFGLDEMAFKAICAMTRSDVDAVRRIPRLSQVPFINSAISMLKDGSIIAPLDFMRFVEVRTF